MNACLHVYICIYMQSHIYEHTHICVCTYICIHTYKICTKMLILGVRKCNRWLKFSLYFPTIQIYFFLKQFFNVQMAIQAILEVSDNLNLTVHTEPTLRKRHEAPETGSVWAPAHTSCFSWGRITFSALSPQNPGPEGNGETSHAEKVSFVLFFLASLVTESKTRTALAPSDSSRENNCPRCSHIQGWDGEVGKQDEKDRFSGSNFQ